MRRLHRIVVAGIAAVLLFDTVASFASVIVGFPYANAAVGSFMIYTTVGYFSYRCGGIGASIGSSVLVGLADVTLGWGISWLIGPGALPPEQRTTAVITFAIVFVFAMAIMSALSGAGIARLSHGSRNA